MSSIVVDKILKKPLLHYHPLKMVTSDPSSAKVGTMILNTTDSKIKVWYASQWQVLHTLTAPVAGNIMGPLLWLTNL